MTLPPNHNHQRCRFLVLVAILLLPSVAAAAELRRGPYLQALGKDGVTIRWRTDAATKGAGLVRYGASPWELDGVVEARRVSSPVEGVHDWSTTITGLKPNRKYYYDVEVATVTLAGPDKDHYFITLPAADQTARVRFWCLGDSGGNRPREVDFAGAKAFGVSATVTVRNGFEAFNKEEPAHILLLGDNAYPAGTDTQYQTAMFEPYDRLLRRMPLWPCVGNHDLVEGVYDKIFTVPGGVETPRYYSVDVANVHLVILDPWMSWWIQNQDQNHPAWKKQVEWLEADLAATKQKFIVLVNHFPVYCDGNYNSDNELLSKLRELLVPLCDQHGVDLFLAGHDHTYQRSYLIREHLGKSNSFDAAKHLVSKEDGRLKPIVKRSGAKSGTIYIVSGTGGGVRSEGNFAHPVMIPFRDSEGGQKRGIATPSSFVFEVEGDRLRGWNVDARGVVLDAFSLRKE